MKKDSIIGYAIYSDEEDNGGGFINDLSRITQVKRMNDGDGNLDYYLINPSKRQFKKMIKENLFMEEDRFGLVQ